MGAAADAVRTAAAPLPATTPDEVRARQLFATYEAALAKAEAFRDRGDDEAAAVFAAYASLSALRPHAGFYASPRLERLMVDIGRRNGDSSTYRRSTDPDRKIKHILHVITETTAVGGLTNMLCRWMRSDKTRRHSLAILHQRGPVVPEVIKTVESVGGRFYRLNRSPGSQIAWAKRLRKIARQHDAVVLHTYGQDVIPMIAFAEPEKFPPILHLNHADHIFWLGVSTADVVINLRDEAQAISINRRNAPKRRNVMAPTVIEPVIRSRSREEAKKILGVDQDTILIFSAARAMKYRSVDGRSFADSHADLLKRHPKAQLWVLGSGEPDDWHAAIKATDGRLKGLPESRDTRVYFEAADIYVDSFPFVSSTSLMEAGSLSLPLVSRFYGPKEARIFAINHPGIDAPTLHGANEAEYVAHIESLIVDPAFRAAKGEEARKAIEYYHTAPSWLDFIEAAYARGIELPPIDPTKVFAPDQVETFSHGEPDRRLYEVFGFDETDNDQLLKAYLGLLPLGPRIALWRELKAKGAFASTGQAMRHLMPEWLARRIKDR